MSDREIMLTHKFLAPINILRCNRILVFVRIVAKNVIILLRLFQSMCTLSNGWARDVWNDFQFISRFDQFKNLRDLPYESLIMAISGDPKLFSRSVKKMFYSDFLALAQTAHVEGINGNIDNPSDQPLAAGEVEPPGTQRKYTRSIISMWPLQRHSRHISEI